MDGYAVRASDITSLSGPLRIIGEIAAGSSKQLKVHDGACVKVMTGCMIPAGADAVVPVEDAAEKGLLVTINKAPAGGAHIRRRGEEGRKGEVVVRKGTLLRAAQTGLCALMGKNVVRVHRRPQISILCTGAELKSGGRVAPHQLRDSNGYALAAAIRHLGHDKVSHRIVVDDCSLIVNALRAALKNSDIVIITGGVSVGKYDFVPEAIKRIGAKILFHGVSMKPGKPLLFAAAGRDKHIFALPGNPLAVLAGFYEMITPFIRCLSGCDARLCRQVLHLPLSESFRSRISRTEYVLARLIKKRDRTFVCPVISSGSADIISAAQADGVFVVSPGSGKMPAGAIVEFTSWTGAL